MDPEHQYSELAVWIDFEDPAFNKPIDPQAFVKTIDEQDHRVRRFVAPPPEAPPEHLGKPLADFEFQTADGKPITAKELAGKTVLLDFWQTDSAPCKAQTPALEEVHQELKGEKVFAMYAVNIDGPRQTAELLAKTFNSWGGTLPVLSDPKQTAVQSLKTEGTPTLMLLDAQGRLQYTHGGAAIDAKALTTLIRRVIAGADLAAEVRAEHAQLVQDYQRELAAAAVRETALEIEVPQPQATQRKPPDHFTATELWQSKAEDIAHPGYILPITSDRNDTNGHSNKETYLVLNGGEAVVQLDASGAKLDSHEIYGGPDVANGFLRRTTDSGGHQHVAVSGVGWQKIYVFDDQWKPALTFPKDKHPGIADVQWSSAADVGKPTLIVGYWGGIGLQGVSLDGKRQWSQRALDQVVQLALISSSEDKSPELWVTSNRGVISVFDTRGKPLREVAVGLRSLMYFGESKTSAEGQNENNIFDWCGLAVEGVGQYVAVGFDSKGDIMWSYPLPKGEYLHQLERIHSVMLPGGKPAWMIAAPDGTIYWLDHEGQPIDKFVYGKPLTGLAMTNAPDAAILLVSTPDNLTAWKLKEETAKNAKGSIE
jgi:thiol-disulfide isomerase/thioredoxin